MDFTTKTRDPEAMQFSGLLSRFFTMRGIFGRVFSVHDAGIKKSVNDSIIVGEKDEVSFV